MCEIHPVMNGIVCKGQGRPACAKACQALHFSPAPPFPHKAFASNSAPRTPASLTAALAAQASWQTGSPLCGRPGGIARAAAWAGSS